MPSSSPPPHPRATAALIISICGALAAVATCVVSVLSLWHATHPSSYTALAPAAVQQRAVEQAAVTPNPNCHPQTPTKMGACNPTQAIAAAQAVAPDGNNVVAAPNVAASHQPAGALGALLFSDQALAATRPLDRAVDVSSYQGCAIDWRSTRARLGITWALAKIGEGPTWTDPCAPHNIAGFKQAGLIYSPYYFARNTLSPEAAADRAWQLQRQFGATTSLPLTLDYETNDAGYSGAGFCSWGSRFAVRWMHDSGRRNMILYTAKFIWPGCVPVAGVLLHDAAYGPSWNLLPYFGATDAWQYSDGSVGPSPHLNGWDSDIWITGHAKLAALAQATPAPKPIAYPYWQACGQLDAIHYWRDHAKQPVSPQQHAQAVAIRRRLARAQVGCAAPGWMLRPVQTFVSYPYRLPKRKGALA